MAEKTLKVTLVKSLIGRKQDHRATVRGLGLRRLHHTVVRGMVTKVSYLLKVEA